MILSNFRFHSSGLHLFRAIFISRVNRNLTHLSSYGDNNSVKSREIPTWSPDSCQGSECRACIDNCPQGALQGFLLDEKRTEELPKGLKTRSKDEEGNWTILANPNLCNGCGDCVSTCIPRSRDGQGALNLVTQTIENKLENTVLWNSLRPLPKIDLKKCSQCGKCITSCPLNAIQSVYLSENEKKMAPKEFQTIASKKYPDKFFSLQINPKTCNGCGLCAEICETEEDCISLESGTKILHENECAPEIKLKNTFSENEIICKKRLCSDVVMLIIKNENIARYCSAGQFVIIRTNEQAERIPLTIADYDRDSGTITLVIKEIGTSTKTIVELEKGGKIKDILGPLGKGLLSIDEQQVQTGEGKNKNIVVVGGGVGIAAIHPISRSYKDLGNNVLSIIGSKTKDMLFWEDEMKQVSDELIVMTDDGSYGKKGIVSESVRDILSSRKIDLIVAVGPIEMMKTVCNISKEIGNIPTLVSLNSIMIDGTGMCGGCRVKVGDERKFTCVDGPKFDGHQVDFDELIHRLKGYSTQESQSKIKYDEKARSEAQIMPSDSRINMPKQEASIRAKNFQEVNLGYTPELARQEAMRCLQCNNPTCVTGCPVNVDIPGFIKLIAQGRFSEAALLIKNTNSLPAITGRVCPTESQCENKCILNRGNESSDPIAIGNLERFAADWALKHSVNNNSQLPFISDDIKSKKIAIIGSGPAGLTAAGDLAKIGYNVTVFEALHKPGGVLVYGIPEFRLPNQIVQAECNYLSSLNVQFVFNRAIGPCGTVKDLLEKDGYHAVFLGLGAGLPQFLDIPGEGLLGVYSSNEFLTRINLMKAYQFPKKSDTPIFIGKHVVVTGGGNVALDSARSALRLGASRVSLMYRRSEAEMTARTEELKHSFEEGVKLLPLTVPIRLVGNDKGWIVGADCIKMELGIPDSSGRRLPVPIKGSEHFIEMDEFIVAVGGGANRILTDTFKELNLNKWGNIITDTQMRTSVPGVFAGGDIVSGSATVINAMGAGKIAANSIHQYLSDNKWTT